MDANGNISLQAELDYETTTSYLLILTASDGVNDTVFEINFSVIDIDEPVILVASTSATSFAEDSLTGINIGTASATDPEGNTITYSLSGTGSENFSVDSAGNISLVNSLDYETAASYTLTLNVSDGVNTTSSDLIITVDDVNEAPSLSSSLAASSFAENTATGTTIATASASDPESQTLTYSLSGTGSENFAVDSSGNVTLVAGLDYETASSFNLTLSASDGVNTTINTIAISISDINEAPSLSSSLAASSFAENTATGTTIATASASDPESQTLTYSLSGTGSENFAVDSSGNITLVSSLDYETTTSYSLTLTASDGTNSISNTINISVADVIELSIALASSSISIDENASSGSSITTTTTTTDGSGSVTYSLSGTGSDKFAVSSDGTITTAASLDYETTTSYTLTLTATDGTNTVTQNFTVNVNDLKINTLAVTLGKQRCSFGRIFQFRDYCW